MPAEMSMPARRIFPSIPLLPRGIYSTDLGNVYVYANGDINVNGSRIAVYDTRQKMTIVPRRPAVP